MQEHQSLWDVLKTIEAALRRFYHTKIFEEGALKAVNVGDDADTVGAIYGQTAGAIYKNMCAFKPLVESMSLELLNQSPGFYFLEIKYDVVRKFSDEKNFVLISIYL